MYQPKPIIALICLLDLMLTLFFASLLMVDSSEAMMPVVPEYQVEVDAAQQAVQQAIMESHEKIVDQERRIKDMQRDLAARESQHENDVTDEELRKLNAKLAALNKQIAAAEYARAQQEGDVTALERKVEAFRQVYADATLLSGKYDTTQLCGKLLNIRAPLPLIGYPSGRIETPTKSYVGHVRADGSFELVQEAGNNPFRMGARIDSSLAGQYEQGGNLRGLFLGCPLDYQGAFLAIRIGR